jgi:hypothetical protein
MKRQCGYRKKGGVYLTVLTSGTVAKALQAFHMTWLIFAPYRNRANGKDGHVGVCSMKDVHPRGVPPGMKNIES